MSRSEHRIHIGDSGDLSFLPDNSVALVVTSPPYPMIEMWDEFSEGDIKALPMLLMPKKEKLPSS